MVSGYGKIKYSTQFGALYRMGRFENLQLNGPGKQYMMTPSRVIAVEQGQFKEGLLNNGIRVYKDKIEFADDQNEADYFVDY